MENNIGKFTPFDSLEEWRNIIAAKGPSRLYVSADNLLRLNLSSFDSPAGIPLNSEERWRTNELLLVVPGFVAISYVKEVLVNSSNQSERSDTRT